MSSRSRLFAYQFVATFLQVAVLFCTLWYLLRAFAAWDRREILNTLGIHPFYWQASGLIWGATCAALLLTLLLEKRYAPLTGFFLTLALFVNYWLERWLIQVSPLPNLVFTVPVSIALFILFGAGFLWLQFLTLSVPLEEKA